MRVFILGLLLAACAHQKVYSLGDELSVVAAGMEVSVRNERAYPSTLSTPGSPIFMARPGKEYATTRCLEGFYNPNGAILQSSIAADAVKPFAICHDPSAPTDPSAFLLGMRVADPAGGAYAKVVKQFQFTARVIAAGATDVQLQGADVQHVHLPADAEAFREHPEIIGAMVTLGVIPAALAGTLKR
jgi:hypothetical protein